MNGIPDLSAFPPGALIALGVAVFVILVLDVLALVSLIRRPQERVAYLNKWVWAAIILLVNVVGAILYFAIGRRSAQAADDVVPARTTDAELSGVADSLYGAAPKDTQ